MKKEFLWIPLWLDRLKFNLFIDTIQMAIKLCKALDSNKDHRIWDWSLEREEEQVWLQRDRKKFFFVQSSVLNLFLHFKWASSWAKLKVRLVATCQDERDSHMKLRDLQRTVVHVWDCIVNEGTIAHSKGHNLLKCGRCVNCESLKHSKYRCLVQCK